MSPRERVEATLEAALVESRRAEAVADRLSWTRLAYLVVAISVLSFAGLWQLPWAVVALTLFAIPVRYHRRAAGRAERARGAVAAARGSLARMDRDWVAMPTLRPVDVSRMSNAAAIRDLDVYGDRSLYRLLDVAQPGLGGTMLCRWLLEDPPEVAFIASRQASVRDLRPRPDFLLESARLCRHGPRPAPPESRLDAFRRWCESPARSLSPVVVVLARIATAAFMIVIIAMASRPELRDPLTSVATGLIVLQFVLASIARRHLRARLGDASEVVDELGAVTRFIAVLTAQPDVAGRFGEIQRELRKSGAVSGFAGLARIAGWNGVRHSPMMHAAMNAFVAFDAHLAPLFDRWHRDEAHNVAQWMDSTAEAQAMVSLATLAFENPGWVMPTVHDDERPSLDAATCGHPLIPADVRVVNPVDLSSPGAVLVVSGSNMSGKTTYLRAVGLNALIALAGGPVCATEMAMRRCRVRTSVRVEDNLATGSSLFFAEVSRIREVVGEASDESRPPVLFLLDEILHGTNAPDRHQASRLVLERLIAAGSSGIITTHDPAIGDGIGAVRQVHFTDQVRGEGAGVEMTFDYLMRPGPATSANAMRILGEMKTGR